MSDLPRLPGGWVWKHTSNYQAIAIRDHAGHTREETIEVVSDEKGVAVPRLAEMVTAIVEKEAAK
jgi:hypothetical protein